MITRIAIKLRTAFPSIAAARDYIADEVLNGHDTFIKGWSITDYRGKDDVEEEEEEESDELEEEISF